jgi:energy-coupling factor transporter ATP-binding protein EcfA2
MEHENKNLILRDASRLSWLEKDYSIFLCKMTLVFGSSGSGKSTIIDEIMYLLKPHIPVCFVIAPTNSSNQAYTGKVPKRFIKDGRDLPKLVEWLEKFVSRQKNTAQMYTNANNLKNLKSLFDKVADSTAEEVEKQITKKAEDSMIFIENSSTLNFAQKKSQKAAIKEERKNMLRKVYKTSIRYHKVNLEKSKSLTRKERATLTFLDINPRVLLVLDDCASKFKKLYKMTTAIKEIFYEGRHMYISTILCSQDDKEIDSELRKNSMVSIFTTPQIATSTFERTSNSYPKHVKERAKLATETVFKQDISKAKHFQKLVYIQNLTDPFRYTIADMYDDYRMCSDSIWEFEEKIGSNTKEEELENNPFFSKYG